jgi:hypothetical protein
MHRLPRTTRVGARAGIPACRHAETVRTVFRVAASAWSLMLQAVRATPCRPPSAPRPAFAATATCMHHHRSQQNRKAPHAWRRWVARPLPTHQHPSAPWTRHQYQSVASAGGACGQGPLGWRQQRPALAPAHSLGRVASSSSPAHPAPGANACQQRPACGPHRQRARLGHRRSADVHRHQHAAAIQGPLVGAGRQAE